MPFFYNRNVASVTLSYINVQTIKNSMDQWTSRHLFNSINRQSGLHISQNSQLATGCAIIRKDALMKVGNFNKIYKKCKHRT